MKTIQQRDRGIGKTTEQIKAAKSNAVFIWCNNNLIYPKKLAKELNREDIKIVSPDWLINGWKGITISQIILDHALQMNSEQRTELLQAQMRVKQ